MKAWHILSIVFFLIIVLSAISLLNFQYKGIVSDEVFLTVSPAHQSYTLRHGESVNAQFTTDVRTRKACHATCSYTFTSVSTGNVLDVGNLKDRVEYTLTASSPGYGQDVYYFQVSCVSKTSLFCTEAQNATRRSVVTVNYSPTEEELAIMNDTKNVWLYDLQDINMATSLLSRIQEQPIDVQQLLKQKNTLLTQINATVADLFVLQRKWDKANVEELIPLTRTTHANHAEQLLINYTTEIKNYNNLLNRIIALKNKTAFFAHYNLLFEEPSTWLRNYNSAILALNAGLYKTLPASITTLENNSFLVNKTYMTRYETDVALANFFCNCTQQNYSDSPVEYANQICSSIPEYKPPKNITVNDTLHFLRQYPFARAKTLIAKLQELNLSNPVSDLGVGRRLELLGLDCIGESYNASLLATPLDTPVANSDDLILSLPPHTTSCCAYGKCTACGESTWYPLVLVHGHSFSLSSDALSSTEVFTPLEQWLLNTHKYLSAGTMAFNDDLQLAPGDLGKTPLTVIFKPSYYLETVGDDIVQSKEASIDTYALRLKESIDHIKDVTGKDKVNIVAHSMGGLVVRRYIQVFGDDSLNSTTLIGTPNKGIVGRVADVCDFFGSSVECQEMQEGSIFLNKLNTATYDVTLIIGRGCDMQGVDGDGVVRVTHALLGDIPAEYMFGNCTTTEFFHNWMVNPYKNPDILEKLHFAS